MSESFNAWIDECRFLPIIRMFDGIRLKMMTKWADSETNVRNWKGDFSPKCIDLFEANRFLAIKCIVFFNGDEGYEVVEGQDRHSVFLPRRLCTCRAWDLTGIPCQHAICAMYHAKIDPRTQISHYYHKDTYVASYRTKLMPVRGKKFWDTDTFLPMQPPPIANLPGRPQKKRTRTDEAQRRQKKSVHSHNKSGPSGTAASNQPQLERLTRHGQSHKCSICNKEGHNKSTCQEPGLRSEVVIDEGTGNEDMHHYADPQKTFPIPNEQQLRMARGYKSNAPMGTRSIQFTPPNTAAPLDLPYQPSGLQWRGQPCVTGSQLLTQRQRQIQKNKDKAKKPTIL